MTPPKTVIAPIVEGHGEVAAVPILLRRIWSDLLHADGPLEVVQPVRRPRSKLVMQRDELIRAVELARRKASDRAAVSDRSLVLIVLDAVDDPACVVAPRLLQDASRPDIDLACVLAVPEFETWFVAAAESLGSRFALHPEEQAPSDPESRRCRKAWIAERMGGVYSETIDQPALTAIMDLGLCRRRARSFDRLCRTSEPLTRKLL